MTGDESRSVAGGGGAGDAGWFFDSRVRGDGGLWGVGEVYAEVGEGGEERLEEGCDVFGGHSKDGIGHGEVEGAGVVGRGVDVAVGEAGYVEDARGESVGEVDALPEGLWVGEDCGGNIVSVAGGREGGKQVEGDVE